jgi:hypothetical protein
MIASTLVSAALLFLGAVRTAAASSCVVFDSNMNLYAFGLNGKDYNAGEMVHDCKSEERECSQSPL